MGYCSQSEGLVRTRGLLMYSKDQTRHCIDFAKITHIYVCICMTKFS